jgi:hypothetical protein
MNEHQKNYRESPTQGDRNGDRTEPACRARTQANPTSSVETTHESGHLDPKVDPLLVLSRLTEAECRLAQLVRSMDRMKRRLSVVESQLARLASQSSTHKESLQMISTILKDLDDPYGFGLSLDEWRADEGADWSPEGER